MRPRMRTVFLVAMCLVLVAGLVAAGPAHHGLHGDPHGDPDGPYCDGCALGVAEPPPVFVLGGPIETTIARAPVAPPSVPAPAPLVVHSPRGPPARG